MSYILYKCKLDNTDYHYKECFIHPVNKSICLPK